jgi:hypothetical protein
MELRSHKLLNCYVRGKNKTLLLELNNMAFCVMTDTL